jgi:hypothetical protein
MPDQVEAFGRGLSVLVDRNAPESSLLLLKPTNRQNHTGGQVIAPGSPQEKLLIEWIRHLALTAPEESSRPQAAHEPLRATAQAVRRLTHSQYNNTVRDLLGDRTRPADRFAAEDFVNGFKNQSVAQDIPPLLAEAYNSAAERLAMNAFRGGRDDNRLLPCEPRTPADEDCGRRFVNRIGLRAFRRPLTDTEQRRYTALLLNEARRRNDFRSGAQLVLEAMLQSPKFLFRLERGESGPWYPYEIASRLSYFLWDTMPDDELFRAAASGELSTEAGIGRAAHRMLADPRSREALDEFLSQWLRFDLLLNAVKDRRTFPQFTEELAVAMTEETRRLVADVVWNGRNFMEVFTAGFSFLNVDLASLYGLPAPAQEFARVDLPAGSERTGILGQGMFLALTGKPGETSPTIRGYFVREHFLCQTVPDPPPGTNSNLPPQSPARPLTNRQRLMEHVTNPVCAGCHNLMDPIGFGLEQYDAIGRFRTKDKITFSPARESRNDRPVTVELDLDPTGAIEGIPNSAFTGPKQLGRLLASSPQCQECVVRQLFRYLQGRKETGADEPVLQRGFAVFRNSGFRLKELMLFLAKELAFSARRG